MKTNETKMNWTTKPQPESTHVIDDGGMIYWVAAPGMSNDEVAARFRAGYDGRLGAFDVTDMASGERGDYEA